MAWVPFAAMAASKLMDRMWPGDGMKKIPTMSKEQSQLFKQMSQMLQSGQLGQGYQGALKHQQQLMDPSSEAVQQFVQPHMDQFNQQTIPQLAERFAGAGAMGGAMSSSGFGQALGAAGAGLQSQLAALKAGLGQQAAGNLMNQYGSLSSQVLGAHPFGYMAPGMTGGQGFMQAYGQAGFPGMQQGGEQLWEMLQDFIVNHTGGGI